jgi:guanylate kinase
MKPVLVTLTSPTAAGKSHLFNYIRDVANLPCLISTTTRAPRAGEKDGVDYYFISEEESIRLEKEDQLAELAIFNGTRYGVTKKEFSNKLSKGVAFLIVEPSGIDHYVQPALDVGALHFKVYVHTDPQIRMKRFRDRVEADMLRTLGVMNKAGPGNVTGVMKEFNTAMNRLTVMLTEEMSWGNMYKWDRTVFGDRTPQENLNIILTDIKKIQDMSAEVEAYKKRNSYN